MNGLGVLVIDLNYRSLRHETRYIDVDVITILVGSSRKAENMWCGGKRCSEVYELTGCARRKDPESLATVLFASVGNICNYFLSREIIGVRCSCTTTCAKYFLRIIRKLAGFQGAAFKATESRVKRETIANNINTITCFVRNVVGSVLAKREHKSIPFIS